MSNRARCSYYCGAFLARVGSTRRRDLTSYKGKPRKTEEVGRSARCPYGAGHVGYIYAPQRYIQTLLNKKITRQAGLITAGSVAAGVWLWNIRDVKKMKSKNYSEDNRFSLGMNHYGQVEARIRF